MSKKHYVSNSDFLAAIIEYKKEVALAEKNNKPKPEIPHYIGDCLLKIATHLSYRPNFISYTFKDDMIGDALENSLVYFDNFDPEKTKNPFAYFTQIMFFAFIRRIEKEKKQTYVKCKILEKSELNEFTLHQHDGGGRYENTYVQFMTDNINEIIKNFEEKKKPKAKKPNGIEKFYEGSDGENSNNN